MIFQTFLDGLVFIRIKNWPIIFFWKMNHWCVKQILHLVPSKNLYICFCYISLHLPKIGKNLISAGHWDQYIVFFSRTPSLIPTIKILCPLLLYFLSLTRLGQHCVQSCRWKILPGQEHLDLFFKQRIRCKGELPFTLFEPLFSLDLNMIF